MTFFFSASTIGFYHSGLHSHMPDDAVPISDAEHENLFTQQMNGFEICAGPDGRPTVRTPIINMDELLASMRSRRDNLLSQSDHTQMPDYPLTSEQRTAWADYRQQLRDLPETITDPADIIWPVAPTGA
ncbi:tail fiber assembly protein [Sphingopyxis yananensis]|uniref:tail fiber assembly protein n=1 Tax=Sphingopyxis yananensis TaxID=2886687 RepID=UPI001D123344|nr:tail fiber assembly protein [Sphingopyxis yananensis]MCC2602744.1 phage tail assembly chaperone [Sphingopyxis yananensis]